MDYTSVDTEVLKQIVQSTDSGLVLFFVLLAVVALPAFFFIHKHAKHRLEVECSRREQDRARENNIIQVVTSNTQVMAGLKTTLETNNAALNATITRIHERIDSQYDTLKTISTSITRLTK